LAYLRRPISSGLGVLSTAERTSSVLGEVGWSNSHLSSSPDPIHTPSLRSGDRPWGASSNLDKIRIVFRSKPAMSNPTVYLLRKRLSDTLGPFQAVNKRPRLTPVLPHLRMLLSLDGFSSDCRPVRGCVIARKIGGTGGVAECCVYREPKLERSDGEVRQQGRVI
jgi:hypothetical protein